MHPGLSRIIRGQGPSLVVVLVIFVVVVVFLVGVVVIVDVIDVNDAVVVVVVVVVVVDNTGENKKMERREGSGGREMTMRKTG